MKIAMIAPIVESVPPQKYGGTERVVCELTEELVRRGHDVTLFASGDSKTSAKLVSVCPKNLREARTKDLYGLNIMTIFNIGNAYDRQKEFDIIHDHTGHIGLALGNIAQIPTIITMHGAFDIESRDIFEKLRRPYIVTISDAQLKYARNINHACRIYNGLDLDHFPYSDTHDNYLLFVGRISMDKGVHLAIEAATHLNMPLIIAAKLDKVDLPYFNEYIGPYLSESIRWVGEVKEDERNKLMSKAMAFLHPVTWPEPFGLTLIESMACGCPVIAFNKGSIPEIIVHEKTGFVVSTVEEMVDAVRNVDKIDRYDCRQHALENFNTKKMVDGYEALYNKILQEQVAVKKTEKLLFQKSEELVFLDKNKSIGSLDSENMSDGLEPVLKKIFKKYF